MTQRDVNGIRAVLSQRLELSQRQSRAASRRVHTSTRSGRPLSMRWSRLGIASDAPARIDQDHDATSAHDQVVEADIAMHELWHDGTLAEVDETTEFARHGTAEPGQPLSSMDPGKEKPGHVLRNECPEIACLPGATAHGPDSGDFDPMHPRH